ncbi:branched-chain amino acid transporter permease [Gulosibacter sp. 10]|uniref:branched-chain amino acid transporter permease n=1 Tax=Gulosibacter sp. 10 TaxID=1255570 RepID=UPI00097E8F03|nr:AzlD domain-containing protein [Gulosibacter sp. 10]SJM68184.1 hypothetical membrane protein [Gulosibacter sp. 10]
MNPWHSVALLAVIWAITFALRAAPLVARRWLRDNEFVRDLGALLPVGVMAVLVLYTVRDVVWVDLQWIAPAVGILVTVALHLWRANVFLSLVGGVGVYSAVLLLV